MEQFNLEKYLANPSRKVVTRDGKKARIVCTDFKTKYNSVLALIDCGESECMILYTKKGRQFYGGDESPNDLFFTPEKHEGWINIYRSDTLGYYIRQNKLYNSKEEADEVAKLNDRTFIKTLKIEWED